MAADWIKMREDLQHDEAVIRMSRRLQVSRATIVGLLHALWSWASKNTCDGKVRGITRSHVDAEIVGHDGFAEAIEEVGWLRFPPSGMVFPNYDHHMSNCAKARAGEFVRKRIAKANKTLREQDAAHSGKTPEKFRNREEAARSKTEETKNPGSSSRRRTQSQDHQRLHGCAAAATAVAAEESSLMAENANAALPAAATRDVMSECFTELCAVQLGGRPVLTRRAASRIAQSPGVTPSKVRFAIHRLREKVRKREEVENPGGFLNDLVLHEEPPASWYKRESHDAMMRAGVAYAKRENVKVQNLDSPHQVDQSGSQAAAQVRGSVPEGGGGV